jgi:CRP-like cAMP-binding protein
MSTARLHEVPGRNRLLASLPGGDREQLRPLLEPVRLDFKQVLYAPNEPIAHVYFPLDAVVSLLTVMEDGASVEIGTVGNEGMVGLPVFLGADSLPSQAFSQVPGDALRMEAPVFREAAERLPALRRAMHRYTQALFNQVAQSAACNRLHSLEERCARWLLMTHDRVGTDRFQLTQEFLAQMLGTRRPSVSVAAGMLQQAGFIRYSRGRITVADREGLEGASCECYEVIRQEFDRLLGPGGEKRS